MRKQTQNKRAERIAQLARAIADHQAHIQVIGSNWGAVVIEKLNASERALVAQLEKSLSHLTYRANDPDIVRRLESVCDKLKAIRAAAIVEAQKAVMDDAQYLADNETKWSKRMTKETSDPDKAKELKDVTKKTLADVVSSGLCQGFTAKEMFASLTDGDAAIVENTVRSGFSQGKTINEIVKELIGTAKNNYTDGAIQRSRSSAVNMARTIANSVANNAKQAFYEANADIIIGVEILATLDGRTCPVCAALDRKRYKTKEQHPTPPIHHQCRCVLLPVTELSDMVEEQRPMAKSDFMADAERIYKEKYPQKDFAELAPSTRKKYYYEAMRAYEARTGESAYTQVAGAVNFRDYFNNHMTEQQRKDWLGKERYNIWKRGNLKLDKFIPPYPNKKLTVKELKELDKSGFVA